SGDGPLEQEGNHPQEQPCQSGLGVEPEGTGNAGFVAGALELPRLLEPGGQSGQRWRELLQLQPNPLIGSPLDNPFNVARPVQVRDPDASMDEAWGLDIKLRNLDARYRPVAVEVGPLRQVENLPGDVFGGQRQGFLTGEGDRLHSALPAHA